MIVGLVLVLALFLQSSPLASSSKAFTGKAKLYCGEVTSASPSGASVTIADVIRVLERVDKREPSQSSDANELRDVLKTLREFRAYIATIRLW